MSIHVIHIHVNHTVYDRLMRFGTFRAPPLFPLRVGGVLQYFIQPSVHMGDMHLGHRLLKFCGRHDLCRGLAAS
jgi:hypothetical protein